MAVIACLAELGVAARKDPEAIGVWVDEAPHGHAGLRGIDRLAKICALGVRIKRGVSLHGIALNVTTDLSNFDLIVPCGLVGRAVTSLQKVLGDKTPTITVVKTVLSAHLMDAFSPSIRL
jgi:lipoyl(octanoyl) transferase